MCILLHSGLAPALALRSSLGLKLVLNLYPSIAYGLA